MARVWIGIAVAGILLCSCSESSVVPDRASYVTAQEAVARDQQFVSGMDAAGSTGISCFSAQEGSTRTTAPGCSIASLKAQALGKLGADEAKLRAAAHQLASDDASPSGYP